MTQWLVEQGEILDSNAEGLICSANPNLNLSGGVGGAFSLRFGPAMQDFLHAHLRTIARNYIDPGNSVIALPCGSKFKRVAHAVAIDAFYDTNRDFIHNAYRSSIEALAGAGCRTIAAACLACGYGRCSIPMFMESIERLIEKTFPGVDSVTFITTNAELADELKRLLAARKT